MKVSICMRSKNNDEDDNDDAMAVLMIESVSRKQKVLVKTEKAREYSYIMISCVLMSFPIFLAHSLSFVAALQQNK